VDWGRWKGVTKTSQTEVKITQKVKIAPEVKVT